MKQCTKCKTTKTINEFAKNKSNASGIHSWCKKCMTDKVLEYRGGRKLKPIKRNDTHKECRLCGEMKIILGNKNAYCDDCMSKKNYERNIKLRFHMSLDEYQNMLVKQNGLCFICQENPEGRRLSIDHDHSCCPGQYTCGKCIRSLVCHRCNMVLGQIKDDVSILKSMINYLQIF
jgi:hypothetical protein